MVFARHYRGPFFTDRKGKHNPQMGNFPSAQRLQNGRQNNLEDGQGPSDLTSRDKSSGRKRSK